MARPKTQAYNLAIRELAQWIVHKKDTDQYITHRQYLDFALYLERKHGIKTLVNNVSKVYSDIFKIDPESKFYIDLK